MSKSKFSKSNSYDEIVRELSILNLLKHVHKMRKNLKCHFLIGRSDQAVVPMKVQVLRGERNDTVNLVMRTVILLK